MNEEVRKYMSSLGKKSASKLTPAQRSDRARKAGLAKGKKKRTS